MLAFILPIFCVVAVKIFKKTAPNGKFTVYLGKRDFGDYGDTCEPVEGVVVVDNDYLQGRKVFGQVVTTFRYGREDDEVMGLHFSRQLHLAMAQVYPSLKKNNDDVSSLQEKLVRKLGDNAHSFTFHLPKNSPPSVTLQPGPEDVGQPLGVEYELKLFVVENEDEKPHKRSTVPMAIRKLQYMRPALILRQPSSLVSKEFVMGSGKLQLEVTLDRDLYFHGDKISVHLSVLNYSKKTVKNIKVSVVQNTEVTVINGHYQKTVASVDSKEGCLITPGANFNQAYYLLPLASLNKDRRGIALDGRLRDTDTSLTSSTCCDAGDGLGIIISYAVRARLYLGALGGELTADVPFKLSNPAPEVDYPGTQQTKADKEKGREKIKRQLTRGMSSDLIFEDFARRRQFSEDQE